jgi:hypothetical protein
MIEINMLIFSIETEMQYHISVPKTFVLLYNLVRRPKITHTRTSIDTVNITNNKS